MTGDGLSGPERARAALAGARRPEVPDRPVDPAVVEATTAWAAWDAAPYARSRQVRLEAALHALVGDEAQVLRVWVNARVGEGMSRRGAIEAWLSDREEQGHG